MQIETDQIKSETHPIKERPTREEPGGEGWSVDIILIAGEKKLRGYYDPKGSVLGAKYFYYTDDEKNPIEDCALLDQFPTEWYYAEEPI
jgi:hypothetical protein